MKTKISILTAAAIFTLASQSYAQETGVSHPESLDDNISATAPVPATKPSPAVPMPATTQSRVVEQTPQTSPLKPHPSSNTALLQTPVETAAISPHTFTVTDDVNSGIVTEVPSAANELPEGTLLKVRLTQEISTEYTEHNSRFEAELTHPIERHGIVMLPAGAILNGRITEMRSGRHIGKGAAIHLEPESITMPDGSLYKLNAQVIDVFPGAANEQRMHITSEGTIISNDRTPGTVAALGATTTTGAITGAALGGGVGAVVGAGIGAGVSTAIWVNQTTTQTLHQGTEIVFSLNQPMLLEPSTK
jgi:hypothetical protein